jgi:hypothetical protein
MVRAWALALLAVAGGAEQATAPPDSRPAVVMVLNSAYIQVFENFIRAPGAKHLARWDVHLLCTDQSTGPLVGKLGWQCRDTQQTGRAAAAVYTKRIPYVLALVRAGRDVLISDLDAIWLQDPLPELMSAEAGIVGSRGKSPPLASRVWGATFCMGFIFFKGTDPRVRMLVDAATTPMREDQTDFNHNLVRQKIVWDRTPVPFNAADGLMDYGTVTIPNQPHTGVRVAMLPHTRFMRLCVRPADFSNVTIAHCHNRGKQQWLKVKSLALLKLWYIPRAADGIAGTDPAPPMPMPGTAAWKAWLRPQRESSADGGRGATRAKGALAGARPAVVASSPAEGAFHSSGSATVGDAVAQLQRQVASLNAAVAELTAAQNLQADGLTGRPAGVQTP